ncbi:hypothetical protein CsSME_00030205 [Camellia sinensis var. sinensis]
MPAFWECLCKSNYLDTVGGRLREVGLIYYLSKKLSSVVENNIGKCLVEALSRLGISDLNLLFWLVHPELKKEKMKASSEVLSEYGNMWSSSVIFVLDEMRKRSIVKGSTTTGEGFEYGVLSWMWTRFVSNYPIF